MSANGLASLWLAWPAYGLAQLCGQCSWPWLENRRERNIIMQKKPMRKYVSTVANVIYQ